MEKLQAAVKEKLTDHLRTPEWVRMSLKMALANSVEIEEHTIDEAYLEFLNEQIELGARGSEWSMVLARRLDSFRMLVGLPLVRICVSTEQRQFVAHLRADDLELIHTETIELG